MAEYITEVKLLNVPLENDYKNTIHFDTREAQETYFKSRLIHSFTNLSYQRKDSYIRVPKHVDDLYNCNYVMYRNTSSSTKWFYAFITDIEYYNNELTYVHIETDCMQTWYFDFQVLPSFVEREHVDDDSIGANTVPECLETGEYICNSHETDESMDSLLSDLTYVIGATSTPTADKADESPAGSGIYNGIFSGVKYYTYDSPSALDIVLNLYAKAGKVDAITGIFMAPKWLSKLNTEGTHREVLQSNEPESVATQIDKPTTLNGYTPSNNKLLTYPYCYLNVSNNNGGSAIYQYEHFSPEIMSFLIKGAICPGCSIRLTPLMYKGAGFNDEESLNLGKFPICNYSVDMYTNWLTQNSVNIGVNVGTGIASMIGSTLTGGIVGGPVGALAGGISGVISGGSQIASTLAQKYTQSFTPPQARGNLNCGDVITADGKNTFHYYKMSIKKEYAIIIDEYFSMFGYQVNRVKTPNRRHRARWWYTKTIDVNIDGAIPNKDLQIIKNCYNNGITFWKNASEMNMYMLPNPIVNPID